MVVENGIEWIRNKKFQSLVVCLLQILIRSRLEMFFEPVRPCEAHHTHSVRSAIISSSV